MLTLCATVHGVPADAFAATGVDHGHPAHSGGLFNLGSDSHLAAGERADSVVSIFGSSSNEGEAGDVVSLLGDTRVTGPVTDSTVAIFGDTYIDAKVEGDVVTVLGNLQLGPHAEIGGDVVAVGGAVHRDPAAIVHGRIENILRGNSGSAHGLRVWVQYCLLYGRPLALISGLGWAWGLAFFCLALYVCIAVLFQKGVFQCIETFESQPAQTVLAALIAMLLTPVLVVLLCVSIIGIAAVPLVVAALFCVNLFGKAVILAWVGRCVAGRRPTGPASHPAMAVLIGGALVLLLYVVPVLGFIVYKILGLLGFGAVVYTLILAAKRHQGAKAAGTAGRSAIPPSTAPVLNTTPPSSSTQAASAAASPRPINAALPRAGLLRRMGALLIDMLLIGFLMGLLHHVLRAELLVLAAYGAIMWKVRGSTIGGSILDIHVVRLDGHVIDWSTALVRALGCFLSLAVAGLGFFWIAFDPEGQAWHDKIAGTVVVRVAKGTPLV